MYTIRTRILIHYRRHLYILSSESIAERNNERTHESRLFIAIDFLLFFNFLCPSTEVGCQQISHLQTHVQLLDTNRTDG